ncbi:MAG: helicase HerA-like domain-containing protein, partial [Dokdonella sp.]
NVVDAITQLGVGEALVSTLQEGGVPLPVERAMIASPGCRIGTITPEERASARSRSPIGAKYDNAIDRESAFEKLAQRTATAPAQNPTGGVTKSSGNASEGGWMGTARDIVLGTSRRQGMLEAFAKSAARNVAGQLGRSILRGVLGSIRRS